MELSSSEDTSAFDDAIMAYCSATHRNLKAVNTIATIDSTTTNTSPSVIPTSSAAKNTPRPLSLQCANCRHPLFTFGRYASTNVMVLGCGHYLDYECLMQIMKPPKLDPPLVTRSGPVTNPSPARTRIRRHNWRKTYSWECPESDCHQHFLSDRDSDVLGGWIVSDDVGGGVCSFDYVWAG